MSMRLRYLDIMALLFVGFVVFFGYLCVNINTIRLFRHKSPKKPNIQDIYTPVKPIISSCFSGLLFPGRWVQKDLTYSIGTLIPCCTWDSSEDYQQPSVCDVSKFRTDSGVYNGVKGGLAYSGGHSCFCKKFQPRDELVYEPYGCLLQIWNASLFCEILKGRVLLLIGDSTMSQTATVLMNSISVASGGCEHLVVFAPSDTLVGKDFGVLNRGQPWMEQVRSLKPDFIVLNAGAHIQKDSDFMGVLGQVLEEHSKTPDISGIPIIWRSQFPGGCGDAHDGDIDWDVYSTKRPVYNYPLLKQWDDHASQVFTGNNKYFIDLRALNSRSDGHVGSSVKDGPLSGDCLHYCTPGPLDDLVPRAFLQLLVDIKSR
jgi:hypothetical protein